MPPADASQAGARTQARLSDTSPLHLPYTRRTHNCCKDLFHGDPARARRASRPCQRRLASRSVQRVTACRPARRVQPLCATRPGGGGVQTPTSAWPPADLSNNERDVSPAAGWDSRLCLPKNRTARSENPGDPRTQRSSRSILATSVEGCTSSARASLQSVVRVGWRMPRSI